VSASGSTKLAEVSRQAGTKQGKISLVSGFLEFSGLKSKALFGRFGKSRYFKIFAFFLHTFDLLET